MAGVTFTSGEQKVRPGVFVRVQNIGQPVVPALPQGIVAGVVKSNWGPINTPITIATNEAIRDVFGSGESLTMLTEAFKGGCSKLEVVRTGTGGAPSTIVLTDTATTPENVVNITAKYPGTRGNNFTVTIRDSLTNASLREFLLYEGATLLLTVPFAKGTAEPDALVSALNSSQANKYVTAEKIAAGNGTLKAVANAGMTGGLDPTTTTNDYLTALTSLEAIDWNVLVVDSEDPILFTSIQAYINRVRNAGKRVMAVLGQKTNVELSTRLTLARSFNDPAIVFVVNGFSYADETAIEGYKATGRVAGMIASADVTESLTHAVIQGATGLVGALSNTDIESALNSGALVFTLNSQKQVQIEQGINTFITPTADLDMGWRKIRRVRTRDTLIDRIGATWDLLIGKINNDANGRATLMAAAQGVINEMINEGALIAGQIYEDPTNPPEGDSAWFIIQVDDTDSAEKLYLTFQFRFAPV